MTCAARGRPVREGGEGSENKALPRHGTRPVSATVKIGGKEADKGRPALPPLHKEKGNIANYIFGGNMISFFAIQPAFNTVSHSLKKINT